MTGRRSKMAGECWEKMLEASCQYYRLVGKAEITKTPEPMRPIKSLGNGKFVAYYEKMAQPDYKGTLVGGQAVVFEAKHTDGDRLQQSVISSEQEKQFDRHLKLGAECFVMVSFGFEQFFKIPWEVFRDMKAHYGRKYITPEDVQEYKVRYLGGVLQFL
jgi:recombination protein U